MSQRISRRFFALCLVAIAFVVSVPAQDYKPLIGKWSMTSENGGDPVKWTLILKQSAGKLAASLATGEGEQPTKGLPMRTAHSNLKRPARTTSTT